MATPEILWQPSTERIESSRINYYISWLAAERGLQFADYESLRRWSVNDIEAFWQSIWDFFQVQSEQPHSSVLGQRSMPGAEWFAGSQLNYVNQVMRHQTADAPAIRFAGENVALGELSWAELEQQVASVAAWLKSVGVTSGDRVACYAPNIPETIVGFLAVASIGAIWSLCAPDLGPTSVLDRFKQIEPVALLAVTSNRFGGRTLDRSEVLTELLAALPSVTNVLLIPSSHDSLPASTAKIERWADIITQPAALEVVSVPFEHPLWIVYSSGTTGLPKPIVHSHGGIIVEFLKSYALHLNLGPGEVYGWYTSSGWIMWNAQIGALSTGATIAIYDGSPAQDDWTCLWRHASEAEVTVFGHGAAFYANCLKAGVKPREVADLSKIHSIGSTGSPLSDECYSWIYAELGPDIWLTPLSGGTDFSGAFVGGCLLLPVYRGEMQCSFLGCDIQAYDEHANSVTDEVGELVCLQPTPSMPLYFWNDSDGQRYHDSYFDTYPGVWRHGDWIRITPRGGIIIYGRSDATINRFGVRVGTAEIYRAVECQNEVLDSLVVDLEYLGRDSKMPLFVILREGISLDQELIERINQSIRKSLSGRFIPSAIVQVAQIPMTLSGKKLEVPVKKILLGQPVEQVANPDTLANPDCLHWYAQYAAQLEAE